MISSKNIENDRITFYDPRYLSEKDFLIENKRTEVAADDVLLTIVGSIGRVAVVPAGLPQFTLQRSVAVLKPTQEAVAPRFLMYLLQNALEVLTAGARGVAQKGIYLSALRDLGFSLPPLPEQHRIVAILDEALAGLATATANAEKNLKNARELFAVALVANIFGDADEQRWETTTVAELALPEKGSIRTGPFGSQLLHGEFVDDGIAVLGIDNAVANEFRWGKNRFITQEKFAQLSRYQVRPGDVLITIMGTCGRCAIVPDDIPVAINTKHLCCISLDQTRCLPKFLHAYFLYHPIARTFLTEQAKGSIMAGLNMGIIQRLPVRLPPVPKQRRIIEKMDLLAEETRRLEANYQSRMDMIEGLKQSIRQKAFSGELTSPPSQAIREAAE